MTFRKNLFPSKLFMKKLMGEVDFEIFIESFWYVNCKKLGS